MTTTINGSSPSITFSDGSAQTSATRPFLNRLINGGMTIDQRNAGASVTVDTTNFGYTADRWGAVESTDGVMTAQQVTTAPTGFNNSLKLTTTTADSSLGATQFAYVGQRIEGYNVADLGWGTANAKTVTISFWARSSLTGTFGGSIYNDGSNRSYPFSYTISVADTWEQKSVTIAGDTSGTWLTTNGIGLILVFGLGVGSTYSNTAGAWVGALAFSATGATSVIGTNGATFYITGVQLEVGSTATSFDYRPYGTELALCQRYYYLHASGNNVAVGMASQYSSSAMYGMLQFPVTMRIAPTISSVSGTNFYRFYRNGTSDPFDSFSLQNSSTTTYAFYNTTEISGTAGDAGWVEGANASAFVAFGAEL